MLNITRGKISRAQKVVIYGSEGIGKTTFAAQFPDPLFIDTEGGSTHLDVARVDTPQTWTALLETVKAVAIEKPCKTLVLDTADWAEALAMKEICAKFKVKGIEDFGYGKGYTYLVEEFGKLLNLLSDCTDVGINVVVTAHAIMRKFEQPDEASAYDRWELKLQKKTAAITKEWADALLFANYKTIVENVSSGMTIKGKARGAKRTLFTQHHACWDAKNRWGLPEEVPFEYSEIAGAFEEHAFAPKVPEPVRESVVKPAPVVSHEKPADTKPQEVTQKLPKGWEPLSQLMEKDKVTVDEICAVSVKLGNYSKDTPPENYDKGYIEGFLVPNWQKLLEHIEQLRDESVPF